MPIKQIIHQGKVPIKVYTEQLASEARAQLIQVAKLPFIHSHIAVMPDVHHGIGATVGSVIPCDGAIIPAAVGVDIGCGMQAIQLNIKGEQLPDNLRALRLGIEQVVPVGFEHHTDDDAAFDLSRSFSKRLDSILSKHPKLNSCNAIKKTLWINQIGTLGGGNHFIEICLDEFNNVWIMLHSGSRGIGNRLGMHFIELAKQDMQSHIQNLPHRDLAYFNEGTQHFADYVEAVNWAQDYASVNRYAMMDLILEVCRNHLPCFSIVNEAINCHHNYVVQEFHFGKNLYVTRKGAIRAQMGDLGIIPGSMGHLSYIVLGKGSAESFNSSAHGAGRCMSRTQAKKKYKRQDVITQTRGIECRKDADIIDEIPSAYKNIDEVMNNQDDLVEVVRTLKQVICIKG